MCDIETAKVNLQAEHLAFEERCNEDLMRERARKRHQEAEERKKRDVVDMKRLQAMLMFAVKSIKIAEKQ